MKKHLKFLVVGKNDEILAVLNRLIEKENWETVISSDETEALEFIKNDSFDVLLLSSGLEESAENELKSAAENSGKNIKVIEHYGGGSGLLTNEVFELFPELRDEIGSVS